MSVPALVTAFIVLVCSAWLMAVPPGSSPDERAHYIKAIAAGRGELYGGPNVERPGDRRAFLEAQVREGANVEALLRISRTPAFRWQQRTTRQFHIPSDLAVPAFGCTASQPEVTGSCLDAPTDRARPGPVSTYTGTYQPYVYVPPGLAMRASNQPEFALRLGRVALLALSAGLLAIAVWTLWTPTAPALSLLGLVASVTPMVLFLSSVLSPSGPEIAAAISLCAVLLRLARGDPLPSWIWGAFGLSGVVLAGTRALGPVFLLVDAGVVAVVVGPTTLWRRFLSGGARAAAAAGAIALATAASLVWEFTRQPRPRPTGETALDAIGPSLSHLPDLARQAIGVFGALDAPMPTAGYVLWSLLLALLVGTALVVGSRRERLTLTGAALALVAATLVMAVVYREIGPLHGRYALPMLVVLPLVASEVVLCHRERLSGLGHAVLVGGLFALAGAVHLLGWWASARRFAVGVDGTWLFPASSGWAPPLGWGPWLALLALGVAALFAAGVRGRGALI